MKNNLKELTTRLLQIKSEKGIELFLKSLLTPQELLEIPRRLQIIYLLDKGLPQRLIAQKLKVGIATVTRGARELKLNKWWKDFQRWR